MRRSPVRPQPPAADTAPAAEARQLAFFRRRGPRERLALTFELIAFARAASRAAIRRANPHLDALEQARLLVTLQFGTDRAAHLRRAPDAEGPMSIPTAILPVVQAHTLPGTEQPVNLASPEDVILNKPAWYVLGNQVSDQQWRDVQAIIRVQGTALDQPYLQTWATALDLGDLPAAALRGERPDG
jgi:hypothetical protein